MRIVSLNPVAKHVTTVRHYAFVTAVLILPVGIDNRRVRASVPDTLLWLSVLLLLRRAAGQRWSNLRGTTRLLGMLLLVRLLLRLLLLLLMHRVSTDLGVLLLRRLLLLAVLLHLLIHVVRLRCGHSHGHHSVHLRLLLLLSTTHHLLHVVWRRYL